MFRLSLLKEIKNELILTMVTLEPCTDDLSMGIIFKYRPCTTFGCVNMISKAFVS